MKEKYRFGNVGFAISIKKCDVVVKKEISEKMNIKESRAMERICSYRKEYAKRKENHLQ